MALLGAAHVHAADHVAAVAAHPAAELVAVYEPDPGRRAVAGGTRAAASPRTALHDADVAVVASTTATHPELVRAAVEAGVALFVEKPLAVDAAQTRALAALVDAAGVPFATGMFLRCVPALRRARALLAAGALGRLSAVEARFTHPGLLDGALPGWMRAGSGFDDLTIHLLDMLGWLRPDAPLGFCAARLLPRRDGFPLDVGGGALLDWAGTPTSLHAGWTARPGGLHLHVEGEHGAATVHSGDLTVHTGHARTEHGEPPHAGAALAAFLDELRGEPRWERPTTADAVAVAELLDSVPLSSRR